MTIGSNLKLLRKHKGMSQEEMANKLEMTRSTYSGYENGVAHPGIENLLTISNFYSITIDTLLKKDFSKFSESEWKKLEQGIYSDLKGQKLRILSTIVDEQNEELIELVPHKASAGYTSGYADPEYLKVLPTFHLPFLSRDKKYRTFPIKGDSMPPVVEGSFVVGEYVQNWMSIRSGTPCIVVTKDDGIVFKILHNRIESDQSFQLCSTNTFYEPYMVHANEILEIWKFVNYISPELPDVQMDDNSISKSLMELQREVHELKKSISTS